MAQKINPISFRLGVTHLWTLTFQTYGKTLKFYTHFFHQYLLIYRLLNKIFLLNNYLVINQEWKITKSNVIINVLYSKTPFENINKSIHFLRGLTDLLSFWFKKRIYVCLYLKSSWSLSNRLLIAYTYHLLNKNYTFKRLLWNLCKFLEFYLCSKKLSYCKYGIFKLQLRGFKIQVSGRLDDSKVQMTQSFKQSKGHLPLTCMKSYVVFFHEKIYTKSGVCGLKIWLYYEFY